MVCVCSNKPTFKFFVANCSDDGWFSHKANNRNTISVSLWSAIMSDPYQVLGIVKGAPMAEVRAAYRRMTARHHPSAGGDPLVQQQIDAAYQAICSGNDSSAQSIFPPVFPELPRSTDPPTQTPRPVPKKTKARFNFVRIKKARVPYEWIAAVFACLIGVGVICWGASLILAPDTSVARNETSGSTDAQKQEASSSQSGANSSNDTRSTANSDSPSEKDPSSNSPPPKNPDGFPSESNPSEESDSDRRDSTPGSGAQPPQSNGGNNGSKFWEPSFARLSWLASEIASIDWATWFPRDKSERLPEFPTPVRPRNGVLSKVDYREIEKATISVDKLIVFYKSELDRSDIDDSSRFYIEGRLSELTRNTGKLLIEDRYLTMQGISDMRQHSVVLLQRWFHQVDALGDDLDSRQFREANKLILEAEKTDPISFQASFYLGLVNVFTTRDFEKATMYFEKCVERGRRYKPLLNASDRENLARAMVNLGNLRIRDQYNIDKACQLWMESLEYRSPSPELVANVLRVNALVDRGYLRPGTKLQESLARWKAELLNKLPVSANGNDPGWMYEPWKSDAGKAMPDLARHSSELLDVVVASAPLLDRVCLECSGVGSLNCTGTGCVRGQVKKSRYVQRQFGNSVVTVSEPYWISCPTCSGRGRLDCQGCSDGIQRF